MTDPITTPEALDALPVGAVWRDRYGNIGGVFEDGDTKVHGIAGHDGIVTADFALRYAPLTVLFRPDAPTPTPDKQPPTDAQDALDALGGWACASKDATAADINAAMTTVEAALRPTPTPAGDDQRCPVCDRAGGQHWYDHATPAARPSAPTVTTDDAEELLEAAAKEGVLAARREAVDGTLNYREHILIGQAAGAAARYVLRAALEIEVTP